MGALSHIRVLDLSRVLAGPWAGQTLADLGADVIKIERPGSGDDTRHWGPPYLRDTEGNETAEAAYYLAANRNKRSVAIDITRPQGQALIRDMAARADIVIENYKVGGLARYGLDDASLRKVNPQLIYCSITGFGQDGPYRNRPGYDFIIQAMGGLMSVTGERDDLPGGGPQKAGVAMADLNTGLYATIAILAALTHRERTGEGQYIDMALLDVQVATLANQATNYLVSGEAPRRYGNAHPNIVPYQAFATRDGHMILAIGNDGQFRRFCELVGRAGLADDPRFATNTARVANRETLIPEIGHLLLERTTDDWLVALESITIPCGPINTLDQVFRDPQVRARNMLIELDHPLAGTLSLVGSPLKLSATPPEYRAAPPLLGEHSRQVLGELLGLDGEALDGLVRAGVVGD